MQLFKQGLATQSEVSVNWCPELGTVLANEEVIDIDDSTASGRLSALRKEMATDSGEKDNSRDELSKRLDSFLKDR